MITIEDIRNDAKTSGFDHVGRQSKTGLFRAQAYGGRGKNKLHPNGFQWWGDYHEDPETAAQEYVDWFNNQQPLTIEDIRNSKRKSGFDHVNTAGRNGSGQGNVKFSAEVYGGRVVNGHHSPAWRGPRRATQAEAAQDYVDYINGQRGATPAAPTLRTAGHQYSVAKKDVPSDIQAARGMIRDFEAQQKAGVQGYVYAITDSEYVKIGYSVNPKKRVAELQTGNARELRLLGTIPGTQADEATLHQKYIKYNVLQEWFTLEPEILGEFMKINTKAAAE